ncbi:MAG: hypothetical protein ACYDCN_01745 [Bacteroidia bacterium]
MKLLEEQITVFEDDYRIFYNESKAFETETMRIQNNARAFAHFTDEFYDEQERFTLDCIAFDKDYQKLLKAIKKQHAQWETYRPTNLKYLDCIQPVRDAIKALFDHIDKRPDAPFKKQAN